MEGGQLGKTPASFIFLSYLSELTTQVLEIYKLFRKEYFGAYLNQICIRPVYKYFWEKDDLP